MAGNYGVVCHVLDGLGGCTEVGVTFYVEHRYGELKSNYLDVGGDIP